MTTTQRTALSLVRTTYEAFGRGDLPAVLALWHPDITWTEPETSTYPGTFHGAQAVVDGVFSELGNDWTDFAVTPDEYLDAGDVIVVLGHYTGSYNATGRSIRVRFAHVVRVRDGLVGAFEAFSDTKLFSDATS